VASAPRPLRRRRTSRLAYRVERCDADDGRVECAVRTAWQQLTHGRAELVRTGDELVCAEAPDELLVPWRGGGDGP
jgi:hypothetical protein